MKNTLVLIVFALCLQVSAQQNQINNQITDSRGNKVLWGPLDKSGLSQGEFASWFNKGYQAYMPDIKIIESLKPILNDYTITVFMGTWCGDSKREVPRFLKIIELANFNMQNLEIIGLRADAPYYKLGPNNEEAGLGIHRVPTFIIKKNGQEINRIVESPKLSLEADLIAIIQGEYQAKYPVVQKVANILASEGISGLKNSAIKKLAKQWKPQVKNVFELNTYAKVLLGAGQHKEAVAVLKLNIAIFPEDARVYNSLAVKLEQIKQPKEALGYYTKAHDLDPENQDYKKAITRLQERQ